MQPLRKRAIEANILFARNLKLTLPPYFHDHTITNNPSKSTPTHAYAQTQTLPTYLRNRTATNNPIGVSLLAGQG